jgi:hypothetical protein
LAHLETLPYVVFYVTDRGDIVAIAVEHDASDYVTRVLARMPRAPND